MNLNLYFTNTKSLQQIYINIFQNLRLYISLVKYTIAQKVITPSQFELVYNLRREQLIEFSMYKFLPLCKNKLTFVSNGDFRQDIKLIFLQSGLSMQNLKSYNKYKSIDILVDILYNIYITNLYKNQLKYIPQLSHDHLLENIESECQKGNIFDMTDHLKDFDRIISGSIYNHHIDLPLNYEEISGLSIDTISFRLN